MVYAPDAAWTAAHAGLLPAGFTAYRAADASRSWFMLDDAIVVLSAGVGDSAGRAVTTTADARIAGEAAAIALTGRTRHGAPVTGPGTAPLAWLRYADTTQGTAVGYVLLGPHRPDATVGLDTVTRSRRTVRLTNPDTAVTKQVFTLTFHQAAGAPHAAFAYAILPGAQEPQLRAYAAGGPVSVLANSTAVQAVRHAGLGLLAVNTFTPGRHRVGRLTVDGAACVLVREAPGGAVEVAVCDPTTQRDTVTLHLAGRPLRPAAPAPGITARAGAGGTTLRATTRHTYGTTLTAALH
jgi:hyaluronate lyase